jgi:LPXTG-site transpeptidase (sortase) family protein
LTVTPTHTVSAAPTIWYVTTIGDDANSCTTIASPCLTINGAIGKAADGDTINVAIGTYTGTGTEVALIDKNITLSGGWDTTFTMQSGTSIIDGQGARRGITVPLGITAILDNFTVQNGFHDNQGGGVRNNGTLTINNSVIRNNVSHWMGGGIFTYGTLTINDTILSGNSAGTIANSGGGGGGAIQNYNGTTTLNNSTVSGNTLLGFFNGSGISNFATLILNNSTVSNNTHSPSINFPASIYTFVGNVTINNSTISGNSGSGIYNNNPGTLLINNSTISNNQRGIGNDNLGTLTLANSIVANNTPYYDCTGNITSAGYNLIGNNSGCTFSATTGDLVGTSVSPIDPKLGPLQDNGGPTYTQALLWGSPAIDAGNPVPPSNAGDACLSTDQRGVTRPIDDNVVVGAVCDIGAYEFNDNTPQVVITPTSYSVNEQVTLVLHGAGISVGDINNDPLTITVTTTDTNSQIFADTGSTGAVVFSGNGTNSLVLIGSVAQLNDLFTGNLGSTFTYRLNDDTPVASVLITVTADDGSSTGSDTAIINITAINDAPVNTVPGAQTVNEDTALIFSAGNGNQISVNDVDVGTDSLEITLSVTNGTLTLADTTGLDFTTGDGTADSTMVVTGTLTDINNALATLMFNPTANYFGSAVLALTTSDFGNTGMGGALTDSDNVNITVTNVNDAPFIANPIPDQNAAEDSTFNFQFAANTFGDPDTSDNLSYSAQSAGGGALPTWLSFNAATRTFSGTPVNDDVGTVSIDVIVSDGNGGTVTDTFSIVVANTNDAPTVASPIPNQNATEDTAFNYQFPANTFADPDVGDILTYSAQLAGGGALPAWLSFDAATRTFSGTPANGNVGSVSIDVIADDGNGGTVTNTFDIVIANVNNAPTVVNPIPNQNATEDAAFNFQFAANTFADPDIGDTFTYSAQLAGGGALPAWLSFDAVTRTFNGTPANSDVGTTSIDVIANDGNGGTVTDTFDIVVANTNDAPTVANPIPDQNATEGSAFNYQFPANTFNDPDVGDTLNYSAQLAGGGALPTWLSFDATTRTFSGTPANSDIGIISIDMIADDSNGGTFTDTFNITVTNDNVAPGVTINQAVTQVDPTETIPILFTAIFSESINISTFTDADIIFVGTVTGTLSVVITEVAPNDGTTFEVSVSGMTASGTVIASISAGTVQDTVGNNNTASTSTDNSVTYNPIYPTVSSTSLTSSYTNPGPNTFTVTFSENVNNPIGNTDPDDVTNPANYLLVEDGVNNIFNTTSCSGGLIADDTQVSVISVVYNATTFTATVTLNTSLPGGNYRLFVCGTTSIIDIALNALNNGVNDYTFDFVVGTISAPTTQTSASALPATGFTPNRLTSLPEQPANSAYAAFGDIWLEIPSQGIKTSIVGVPQSPDNTWDVTWLGNDTGWLNGTAFPTWNGNSVLTAHVTNANGLPGPFANLKELKYGEQIIVHLFGGRYIFEVRDSKMARPYSTNFAFESLKDHSYLTLITCQGYNPLNESYYSPNPAGGMPSP